ncbi:hypothetical protein SOVF_042560 [Spinacia oleracea]|nr:hypothetical protein SOVF_042560 [Spinacia oleracea]
MQSLPYVISHACLHWCRYQVLGETAAYSTYTQGFFFTPVPVKGFSNLGANRDHDNGLSLCGRL